MKHTVTAPSFDTESIVHLILCDILTLISMDVNKETSSRLMVGVYEKKRMSMMVTR